MPSRWRERRSSTSRRWPRAMGAQGASARLIHRAATVPPISTFHVERNARVQDRRGLEQRFHHQHGIDICARVARPRRAHPRLTRRRISAHEPGNLRSLHQTSAILLDQPRLLDCRRESRVLTAAQEPRPAILLLPARAHAKNPAAPACDRPRRSFSLRSTDLMPACREVRAGDKGQELVGTGIRMARIRCCLAGILEFNSGAQI